MGCLRAEKILDYIADPLRKCLRDENPYVRKTAALGVMKLYDMKPSLAIENGFIEMLQDMVTDSNPMVRSHPQLDVRIVELTNCPSPLTGCRERCRCANRDPGGGRRRAYLRPRLANPLSTVDRSRRMHRMGPNRDSRSCREVQGRGRKGGGAYLRTSDSSVPACKRQRGVGRNQGASPPTETAIFL